MIRLVRPGSINKQGTRCKVCTLLFFDTHKQLHRIAGYCSPHCMSGKKTEKQKRKVLEKQKKRIYAYNGSVPINKPFLTKKYKKSKRSTVFYDSREWQTLRYKVLKLHERKCMVCFRTNLELHVDHIKPISKFPDLALKIDNLQILCRDCNLGKSNKDCVDWRPSG